MGSGEEPVARPMTALGLLRTNASIESAASAPISLLVGRMMTSMKHASFHCREIMRPMANRRRNPREIAPRQRTAEAAADGALLPCICCVALTLSRVSGLQKQPATIPD